jgi:alpha-ketoglutarate-dependent taurine dioxygenase
VTRLIIEPLDATLGAVVTGVRLADLDDDTWRTIEAAFNEHAVLVFPGQHLTGDEQRAFARRFGAFDEDLGPEGTVPISNRRRDGTLLDRDDPVIAILRGNEGWHTDSSYMPVAAKASMLSAHVVPASGGNTEWADMRAAYDALSDEMKRTVDGLSAHHSLIYSQEKIGEKVEVGSRYGFHDGPAPLRPLVKVHPDTGRRSLFIGRHAYGIPGMSDDESAALLDELLDHTCRPPRVYTHDWQVGDLVVWDNRCVLHRVRPWDLAEPRVMRHTRIKGDPVAEAALT